MWFHIRCLGEAAGKRSVCGPLGTQLRSLPIVRGWTRLPAENWMTVGSGRLLQKVKSSYKEEISQDWGDLIGERFVEYSTTALSLLYTYSCPTCKELV